MLDFSDRTRTGISILTSAADRELEPKIPCFHGKRLIAEAKSLDGPFTIELLDENFLLITDQLGEISFIASL